MLRSPRRTAVEELDRILFVTLSCILGSLLVLYVLTFVVGPAQTLPGAGLLLVAVLHLTLAGYFLAAVLIVLTIFRSVTPRPTISVCRRI